MAKKFHGRVSLELLSGDLRQASRQLYKTPVFTATVALVLAIGMGASVATFSILRNVLLDPLPFNQPDRLVQIVTYWPKTADHNGWTAPLLDAIDWKASVDAFQDVACTVTA
jgi:putative ABC transport system permease protein